MKVGKLGAVVMGVGGIRVGGTRKTDAKVELEKAVKLAKEVDQVVVFAGLNVSFQHSTSWLYQFWSHILTCVIV